MTKREILNKAIEEKNGDFWYAVETLINQGWSRKDFEEAGIEEDFQSFDNPVEENMDYLRKVAANDAGATWMETVLTDCEDPEEWLGLSYPEFLQAVSNANSPAFPAFESGKELDAAYQGAWDSKAGRRARS